MRIYILLFILFPVFVKAEFLAFNGSIIGIYSLGSWLVRSSFECYQLCNQHTHDGCYAWQVQTYPNGTNLCNLDNNPAVRALTMQVNVTTQNTTYGYGGCRQCANQALCVFLGPNVTCECLPGYVGNGQLFGANANCSQASACALNAANTTGSCVCNPGYDGDGLADGFGCSSMNASHSWIDKDFYGGDFAVINMFLGGSALECQKQCNSLLGCTNWSFETYTNICYMKNNVSVGLTSHSGIIAGLGGCSLCAPNATCSQTDGNLTCTCEGPFAGDGWSNCAYVAPTTPAPTTPVPTTPAPTTIAPTTVAPTTSPPTTQPPTTDIPTSQPMTTQPPTTALPTTSAPTTVVPTTTAAPITTAHPTEPPFSCHSSVACTTTGGLIQTDKSFNGTDIAVSGSLSIGSTVVLNNSTIFINGSLNLAPSGVLNVTSNGAGPAINSTSFITLNGSINVNIQNVDTLNFTTDGHTFNYTVIVSESGINGEFSNVAVSLDTVMSLGCDQKNYTSKTSYTPKSLNIVVTQSRINVCGGPSGGWSTWMFGVIGGAVALIAVVVGVVLWKYKSRRQVERFTIDY